MRRRKHIKTIEQPVRKPEVIKIVTPQGIPVEIPERKTVDVPKPNSPKSTIVELRDSKTV